MTAEYPADHRPTSQAQAQPASPSLSPSQLASSAATGTVEATAPAADGSADRVWAGEWVEQRLGLRLPEGPAREMLGLALRLRNPQRAQLLVSQVLGKHVPQRPATVYRVGYDLGRAVRELLGPQAPDAVVLGYAETATGLGHCVADGLGGHAPARYLHSTRRSVAGVAPVGGFEETHSHATSHLLLPEDPNLLAGGGPLVLVDDELSTGNTIVNTIASLHERFPRGWYVVAALVDVRDATAREYLAKAAADLGVRVDVVATVSAAVGLPSDAAALGQALTAAEEARQPCGSLCDGPRAVLRSVDLGWPSGLRDGARHGYGPADRTRLDAALPAMAAQLASALDAPALDAPASAPSASASAPSVERVGAEAVGAPDLSAERAGGRSWGAEAVGASALGVPRVDAERAGGWVLGAEPLGTKLRGTEPLGGQMTSPEPLGGGVPSEPAARARRVLVLGTEELMYTPLRLAAALQEALDAAAPGPGDPTRPTEVLFSTTTRSPALAVDDPGYAIRTRLTFPAHDAPEGTRYAYNVAPGRDASRRFDAIVLVLDSEADPASLHAPGRGLLERLRRVTDLVLLAPVPAHRPTATAPTTSPLTTAPTAAPLTTTLPVNAPQATAAPTAAPQATARPVTTAPQATALPVTTPTSAPPVTAPTTSPQATARPVTAAPQAAASQVTVPAKAGPLHGPAFSSYRADEVSWLLKDLSEVTLEAPVEEREEAVQQGGAHYAESLPIEYQPTAAYQQLFHQALRDSAVRIAEAVATVTESVLAERDRGRGIVLASLARAGTPVGILMRRWAQHAHGLDLPHYAVSIVRGRGIDTVALRHLAEQHDPADVVFVDGWTGKGAITRELDAALAGTGFDPAMAVLADPAHCVRTFGTREDFLIPSACLNSTVSGLVSRTVLRPGLIGPDDFHGAKYYRDLAGADVSATFLDAVSAHFPDVRAQPQDPAEREPDWSGWAAVERISEQYGIHSVNLVKPGVGETTRVLLRRVPWRVLVRRGADAELGHVRLLAEQRGVPVEAVDDLPYSCVGLIHPQYTRGATGDEGTAV